MLTESIKQPPVAPRPHQGYKHHRQQKHEPRALRSRCCAALFAAVSILATPPGVSGDGNCGNDTVTVTVGDVHPGSTIAVTIRWQGDPAAPQYDPPPNKGVGAQLLTAPSGGQVLAQDHRFGVGDSPCCFETCPDGSTGLTQVLTLQVPPDLDPSWFATLWVRGGLAWPSPWQWYGSGEIVAIDVQGPPDGHRIAAPNADDRTFVVDDGPDLDTDCTQNGSLHIEIPVTRYAGPVDVLFSTLQNWQTLVDNGLLEPFAELQIAAWDVDSSGAPYPETDHVFFNGQLVDGGSLQGVNNKWCVSTFPIHVAYIRFPAARGTGGNPPSEALNEVEITIDTLDGGWCTPIDWVALKIELMSPSFSSTETTPTADSLTGTASRQNSPLEGYYGTTQSRCRRTVPQLMHSFLTLRFWP